MGLNVVPAQIIAAAPNGEQIPNIAILLFIAKNGHYCRVVQNVRTPRFVHYIPYISAAKLSESLSKVSIKMFNVYS